MLQFQMLLIYTTEGFNVHSHLIRVMCAEYAHLLQFILVNHLENLSCLEVRGVKPLFLGSESVGSLVLLHDNARRSMAQHTRTGRISLFGPSPPLNSHLVPSGLHVSRLKERLSRPRFSSDEDLRPATVTC